MVRPTEGKDAKVVSVNLYQDQRSQVNDLLKARKDCEGVSDLIRHLINEAHANMPVTTNTEAKAIGIAVPLTIESYKKKYYKIKEQRRPRNQEAYVKMHTSFIEHDPSTYILFPNKTKEDIYALLESERR